VAEIAWGILPKVASGLAKPIAKRFLIDVEFEKGNNPTISVAFDTARIRYKLMLHTHGFPKYQPKVKFPHVRSLGEVRKKAASPSGLGEIDDSMRLKLFKDELPANTDIEMFVDFDVRIEAKRIITMDFQEGQTCVTKENPEITVLVTNSCDFPIEQILLDVDKSTIFRIRDARVLILDKTSHNPIREIDAGSVRKGDDQIKWVTSFGPHEALLFKVLTVAEQS
jgi:hypothetical protein